MPVEIEGHTVPHFKATMNVKVEPEGLEHEGIFIANQARPNLGHLLHKTGFVDSDMHNTVYTYIYELNTARPRNTLYTAFLKDSVIQNSVIGG